MTRLISLVATLIMLAFSLSAQETMQYECWLDQLYIARQKGTMTGEKTFELDVSLVPVGLHTVSFRAKNSDGKWGAPYTKHFFNIGDETVTRFECWIDNLYALRQKGDLKGGERIFEIDMKAIPFGVHSVHFRAMNGKGEWGAPYTKYFYNIGNVVVTKYEYWLDNLYALRQTGDITGGEKTFEVDINKIPSGLHKVSFRMKDSRDIWGAPYTKYFYNAGDSTLSKYEYWLDSDYDNRTAGDAKGNSVAFDVNLEKVDKSRPHFLNFRAKNGLGEWGSVCHKLLLLLKEGEARLTGYRHALNGKDLGEGRFDTPQAGEASYVVPLPDDLGLSLNDMPLKFDGDNVSVECKDTVSYRMQLNTEAGWGSPVQWAIPIGENFSTTAVEMGVPSERKFAKPASTRFVAVKFTAGEAPVFVHTDQAARFDIYKDGVRAAALTPEDLAANKSVKLAPGTYIGILYDAPVDKVNAAADVTLRLMDTDNVVPTPEIALKDKTVTISCRMEGTDIYYTLDGKTPTKESTRYTEPFTVGRNCVVKAIAVAPDSGIKDSDVAQLQIDSFKVAKPAIGLDKTNVFVVISSDQTEGVRTYYTLDGSEPTEASTLYTEPFIVPTGKTVRARSFKDGYAPSDIASYDTSIIEIKKVRSPEIYYNKETCIMTMKARTEDSEIYYAIGNREPSAMTRFPGSLKMTCNDTVFAQARKPGLPDSEVVWFAVKNFQLKTPAIGFRDFRIVVTPDTVTGTRTYYTLDGSEPTEASALYSAPIEASGDVTVKARSFREKFNPSETATFSFKRSDYTVLPPAISYTGNTVTLTAQTAGSEMFYSIGTADNMVKYAAPFQTNGNCTVFAMAKKAGMYDSETVSKEINDLRVPAPTWAFDGATKVLRISCGMENARISYRISGGETVNTGLSAVEIALTQDCTVEIWATADGYLDSETVTATIEIPKETCKGVAIEKYDGRYLTLKSDEPDATILYTLDGSDPKNGTAYAGEPVDVGGLVTVNAIVTKEDFIDSEPFTGKLLYYADENKAMTAEAGNLSLCYGWAGGSIPSKRLAIIGVLNAGDYAWLRTQTAVKHLDLSEITNGKDLTEGSLALPELVSVVTPADFEGWYTHGSLFGSTEKLCAVEWTSGTGFPSTVLDGVSNSNLLVYISGGVSVEGLESKNIVKDGHADKVDLKNGYPFYCPKEFGVSSIGYRRNFQKVTGIDGKCAGWETISLPFDVQTVEHSNKEKGVLLPFGVQSEEENKRFWLYAPDAYDWVRAGVIEANRPYLIAMPNNPAYYEPFNVNGTVNFSSRNVTVPATPDSLGYAFKGSHMLYANYSVVEKSPSVFTVNDEFEDGGVHQAAGSVFVADQRDARPFEAYLTSETARRMVGIFDRSAVEGLMAHIGLKVWSEGRTICILAGFSTKMKIYDPEGRLLRVAEVRAGEVCRVDDFNPGIYIVGKTKIHLR